MLDNKKGVSSVIATVLLIIVVIAAVGVLGYFITDFIKENLGGGRDAVGCIGTELSIEEINTSANEVSVKRDSGQSKIDKIKVSVEGEDKAGDTFGQDITVGEFQTLNVGSLDTGDRIGVGAVISGQECGITDSATAP